MSVIVFASDLHLGVPNYEKSRERERLFIEWLDTVASKADEIYLVGDMFDFWFEYKEVIPKYHTRLLGKLAQICDSGKPVHVFTGNHDLWMFGYLEKEIGVKVHHAPIHKTWDGKSFFIGHGDGLGPGDKGYKRLKKIFTNPFFQWCFRILHPDFGVKLASYFSHTSRNATGDKDKIYLGDENEWLLQYIKYKQTQEHNDFYIFGHRHLPIDKKIDQTHYINLGDWISDFTYAIWNGEELTLQKFK